MHSKIYLTKNIYMEEFEWAKPFSSLGGGVVSRDHTANEEVADSTNHINKHKSSSRKQQSIAETPVIGEAKILEWKELWKNELNL